MLRRLVQIDPVLRLRFVMRRQTQVYTTMHFIIPRGKSKERHALSDLVFCPVRRAVSEVLTMTGFPTNSQFF